MNESTYCLTSLLTFGIISVLDFAHFNRYVVLSHCFNLISLIAYVEHIFICLFAHLYIFFGEQNLLRSLVRFKIRWFIFLLLSFKCSLCILNSSPLADMSFANRQGQVCGLSFHFLDIVSYREVFNFNEVQFTSCFFQELCFWCYI